jgi:hypothetical protein
MAVDVRGRVPSFAAGLQCRPGRWEAAMAFDTVRVRKVRSDDEDSFLDWDGRATLFDDDEEDEGEVEIDDPEALDDEDGPEEDAI